MSFQNVQNHDMNLVLSSDAKPRLKWTPELHQRFVESVNRLGGPDKATPKALMRMMGIHGLTLYHLKSHLQKFRLGKSQQSSQVYDQNKHQDYEENSTNQHTPEIFDGPTNQINPNSHITQALHVQMEVQKKLHEQIEVQKHLQLRIEAQGKYLQSVLKKAQETLARYNSSSIGEELAKAELSQLVSMVNTGHQNSSLSVLTETERLILKDNEDKKSIGSGCSLESSLTSSEMSETKEEINKGDKRKRKSVVLSLMEMYPGGENRVNSQSNMEEESKKVKLFETFDLNSKCLNEFETDSRVLDLNFNGHK